MHSARSLAASRLAQKGRGRCSKPVAAGFARRVDDSTSGLAHAEEDLRGGDQRIESVLFLASAGGCWRALARRLESGALRECRGPVPLAFEVSEDGNCLLAAGGGLAEPCEPGGLRAAAGDALDLDAAPVVGDAAGGGAEAVGGRPVSAARRSMMSASVGGAARVAMSSARTSAPPSFVSTHTRLAPTRPPATPRAGPIPRMGHRCPALRPGAPRRPAGRPPGLARWLGQRASMRPRGRCRRWSRGL